MRCLSERPTRNRPPANFSRTEVALERESCRSRAFRKGPGQGQVTRPHCSSLRGHAQKHRPPERRGAAGGCGKTAHSSRARCRHSTCGQSRSLRSCGVRRSLERQVRQTGNAVGLPQGNAAGLRARIDFGCRPHKTCHCPHRCSIFEGRRPLPQGSLLAHCRWSRSSSPWESSTAADYVDLA